MGLISTIFIGFFIGVIAKLLMPGRDPGGFIVTTALGIGGSVVASYIGQNMGYYQADEPANFVSGVFGAMLILFAYRLFIGRSRS